jgi:hypothetical protein
VPEELLDFVQILSMWLSRIVAALWRSPWAVISPTPSALLAARSRRLDPRAVDLGRVLATSNRKPPLRA